MANRRTDRKIRKTVTGRVPSETDEQISLAQVLRDNGLACENNVPVKIKGERKTKFADTVVYRDGCPFIVLEVKKSSEFDTRAQREKAHSQGLLRYAGVLGTRYVGSTDGTILFLYDRETQRTVTSELRPGCVLDLGQPVDPLDFHLGFTAGDYDKFGHFVRESSISPTQNALRVLRQSAFNEVGFLKSSDDIAFIEGEAHAGKSTYAAQLSSFQGWDAIPLDAGSLSGQSFDEKLSSLISIATGQNGHPAWAFLAALAERRRVADRPIVFLIDALDEWTLPVNDIIAQVADFAANAKRIGSKVVIFSRPVRSAIIRDDRRISDVFATSSVTLGLFDEFEQAEAERQYFDYYCISGTLSGRARSMCALPGMLAATAEAYAGENFVDPDLTEPKLYAKYRGKKAEAIAKRGRIGATEADATIDLAAWEMLRRDAVELTASELIAAGASGSEIDELESEGVIVSLVHDILPAYRRYRFRFGRVRDDAVTRSRLHGALESFIEEQWTSVVGGSALEYAAATDSRVRDALLRWLVQHDQVSASHFCVSRGWYTELEAISKEMQLPSDVTDRIVRSGIRALYGYPLLFQIAVHNDPGLVALFAATEPVLPEESLWNALRERSDAVEDLSPFIRLTTRMIEAGRLSPKDATPVVDAASARRQSRTHFEQDGDEYWQLVTKLIERLHQRDAGRLLRQVLPVIAIAHGTAHLGDSPMQMDFFPGISPSSEIKRTVEALQKRMTPRSFLCWAFATLLIAHDADLRKFSGRYRGSELSGSGQLGANYADNAWLLRFCIPIYRAILAEKTLESSARRLISLPPYSRLHSSFRARALILCAPIEALEMAHQTLGRLMGRNGGVPALQDAINCRSVESDLLGEIAALRSLRLYRTLTSAQQSIWLQRRIADGDKKAFRIAKRLVRRAEFRQFDMFGSEFFSQMHWATKKPNNALDLIVAAVDSGYSVSALERSSHVVQTLKIALECGIRLRSLRSRKEFRDILARLLPSTSAFSRFAARFYAEAERDGKRAILLHVHDLPLNECAEVLNAAFAEIPLRKRSVRPAGADSVVFASLRMSIDKHKDELLDRMGFDVVAATRAAVDCEAARAALAVLDAVTRRAQKDKRFVRRTISAAFHLARTFNSCMEPASEVLDGLWPLLTIKEQLRFWNLLDVAKGGVARAFKLYLRTPSDTTSRDRAIKCIRTASPDVRSYSAWLLYQWLQPKGGLAWSQHTERLVECMIEHSEQETARNVILLLEAVAKHTSEAFATEKLWHLIRKSIEGTFPIWGAYKFPFNYSTIALPELAAVARSLSSLPVSADRYFAVSFICEALLEYLQPRDAELVRTAFTHLGKWEQAINAFRQWRDLIAA